MSDYKQTPLEIHIPVSWSKRPIKIKMSFAVAAFIVTAVMLTGGLVYIAL